jgi:hypothetical protein
VLSDAPVGYWPLSETTGATAYDLSGNSNNGAYSGAYTLGASGMLPGSTDTCVTFSGGAMTVADAPPLRLGTGPLTIEMWINPSSQASFATLIDNVARPYSIFTNSSGTSQIYPTIGGSQNGSLTTSAAIANGTRRHFVLTVDGSHHVTVYLDGVSVLTSTFPSPTVVDASGFVLAGNPSGGGGLWQGNIQELALYATALSPARVAAHYSAGVA